MRELWWGHTRSLELSMDAVPKQSSQPTKTPPTPNACIAKTLQRHNGSATPQESKTPEETAHLTSQWPENTVAKVGIQLQIKRVVRENEDLMREYS
ncbi:MAG: hypothetical protein OXI04_06415 [Bacteroidota bacterium]|nr:hypothetical protein [Bacteroidota bacterium]